MWNDVAETDAARGIYKVCGKYWNVGKRYKLHEHIGSGSYGDVCRATDCEASLTVALKRVPDVLCCPLLAKRVLREVCIMRRLAHPYVITLTNVFTNLSMDVNGGIDLYIATEFADGGDMYHMIEPLSVQDVKFLMWQLLTGVSYIHSCRVWHRDIKSENVLLTDAMCVKICDFGLSRSAEESTNSESQAGITGGKALTGRKSLTRQYTKMVVTPSYRAPEVIMSRGQYGSSIDIWSLGCIFWELLMRCMHPDVTGPPLRPLFGVREEPVTPGKGESYAADKHTPLHDQLDVIFDVIGTPGWSDIESVPSESWRSYLKHLPGRAGNLTRQLSGYVDQEAVDLLLRMLAFNPSRRCTAEEALSHIYFKGLERSNGLLQASFEATTPGESVCKIKDPAIALDILERELEASVFERDGGRHKLEWLLQQEIEQQQQQNLFCHSLLSSMQYLRRNAALSNNTNGRPFSIGPGPGYVPMANMIPIQAEARFADQFSAMQQYQELPPGIEAEKPVIQKKKPQRTIVRQGSLRIEIMNPSYRVTRSSVAAQVANGNERQSSQTTRVTRNMAAKSLPQKQNGEEQQQQQQQIEILPRRSPRLRDLQAGELPHRKRPCLKAG